MEPEPLITYSYFLCDLIRHSGKSANTLLCEPLTVNVSSGVYLSIQLAMQQWACDKQSRVAHLICLRLTLHASVDKPWHSRNSMRPNCIFPVQISTDFQYVSIQNGLHRIPSASSSSCILQFFCCSYFFFHYQFSRDDDPTCFRATATLLLIKAHCRCAMFNQAAQECPLLLVPGCVQHKINEKVPPAWTCQKCKQKAFGIVTTANVQSD